MGVESAGHFLPLGKESRAFSHSGKVSSGAAEDPLSLDGWNVVTCPAWPQRSLHRTGLLSGSPTLSYPGRNMEQLTDLYKELK